MLYLIVKSLISGVIVMVVSEIAKRNPSAGALVASLPLISILGMLWLWHDTHDRERLAVHAGSTFWMVLPSLPMFLLLPFLLRHISDSTLRSASAASSRPSYICSW